MCIIAYIPKNIKIADETIQIMFQNNPDGAGVMSAQAGQVVTKKGFMNLQDLLEYYHTIPSDVNRAIHCRIATSGGINKAACHPFPISTNISALKELKGSYPDAFMHNGIINFCNPREGMKSTLSDSMLLSKNFLAGLKNKYMYSKEFKNTFEALDSSRLCLMHNDGTVSLVGTWICQEGIYYSNETFRSFWDYGAYEDEFNNYKTVEVFLDVSLLESEITLNNIIDNCYRNDVYINEEVAFETLTDSEGQSAILELSSFETIAIPQLKMLLLGLPYEVLELPKNIATKELF